MLQVEASNRADLHVEQKGPFLPIRTPPTRQGIRREELPLAQPASHVENGSASPRHPCPFP